MGEKLDFDPLELLDLTEDCQKKEIIGAFRKMALKWHPDKNPDRPEMAKQMFLKIQKSFEILIDPAARAALVRLKKAKEAHKQRVKNLDAKRQKLRDDLEAREKKASSEKADEKACREQYMAEVERLRKEGSKILRDENEKIDKEIARENLKKGTEKAESVKNSQTTKFDTNFHTKPELNSRNKMSLSDFETLIFAKAKQVEEQKKEKALLTENLASDSSK